MPGSLVKLRQVGDMFVVLGTSSAFEEMVLEAAKIMLGQCEKLVQISHGN